MQHMSFRPLSWRIREWLTLKPKNCAATASSWAAADAGAGGPLMSLDDLVAEVPDGWGWSIVAEQYVGGEIKWMAAVCDWGSGYFEATAAHPAEALSQALSKIVS
jgi:hypothetical protein